MANPSLSAPSAGEELAERVRTLRTRRGLTQEAFATRSGISVSFVSLLERGIRSPSYDTLVRIAQALEVPLAELFRQVPLEGRAAQRLADYARARKLTSEQAERLVAVADAIFSEEPEREAAAQRPLAVTANAGRIADESIKATG